MTIEIEVNDVELTLKIFKLASTDGSIFYGSDSVIYDDKTLGLDYIYWDQIEGFDLEAVMDGGE